MDDRGCEKERKWVRGDSMSVPGKGNRNKGSEVGEYLRECNLRKQQQWIWL